MKHIQDSGAVAVVVVNDRNGALFTMAGDDVSVNQQKTVTIPAVLISQSDGITLKKYLIQSNANDNENDLHHDDDDMYVDVFAAEPYSVDLKKNTAKIFEG